MPLTKFVLHYLAKLNETAAEKDEEKELEDDEEEDTMEQDMSTEYYATTETDVQRKNAIQKLEDQLRDRFGSKK